MKTTVYTQQGKKHGDITLPEEVFNVPWNSDLVHQVLSVQRMNRARPTAHAKDRSEQSGGGRKPWRQKGTGRARHGSNRSPIWRSGGVTHGPRNEKVLSRRINQKMKRKALYAILSRKYRDGEVIFLDTLSIESPKTKEAKTSLQAMSAIPGADDLAVRKRNAAFIAVPEKDEALALSFRNFSNVVLDEVRNLNPLDVARYKYIIIAQPQEALSTLGGSDAATEKKANS